MTPSFHHRVANLSEWHRIKSSHHRGKEVTAIVVRVHAHALLCRVGSYKGPPAIIRRQELSWSRKEQQTSGYREGDSIEAVVVEYGDERRELVLSKKRAEVRLEEGFPMGAVYSGTIVELPSWGFRVHLGGGVDGFLLREETPDEAELPPAVRLQIGDMVTVEVIGYDDQQGNPRLSMNRAINKHQDMIRREIEALAPECMTRSLDEKRASRPLSTKNTEPMNILVLDDTESVIHGVTAFLQSAGHRIVTAKTRQEIPALLEKCPRLDAALLDIQLDFESIRGADLPILIRERSPGCAVYLFTGNDSVLDAEDLRDLKDHIHGIIPKQWSPQDILAVLHREKRSIDVDELRRALPGKAVRRNGGSSRKSDEVLVKQAVDRHLESLGELWHGSRLLVAEYDLSTTRLFFLKARGFSLATLAGLNKQFMDSELGDALRDMNPLSLSKSDQPHPAVLGLFEELEADHVIAAPLKVEGYPRHVAVFCFGPPRETQIPGSLRSELERALSTMALEIEKELLQTRIFRFQKAAGTGALVLGMTHELRNLMSPVRTEIETIRHCLADPSRLTKLPEGFVKDAVDRVSEAAAVMQALMEGFLGMTKLDEEEELPLSELLQEAVKLCRDSARQHEVFLRLDQDGEEGMAMKLPGSVRQVFMNLILNAIQHVAQTGVKHKLVTITVRPVNREGRLRIDITDNGYGVAASQRESMFEMFVTTRPTGTGLGLFVAKEIITQVGGEIRMKSDCTRYRDNTFSVFLPTSNSTSP